MHIAMHAVGKITLFFCAGAIDVALHKQKVSELDGIGRQMPFTMVAFAVASLSIIGIPPLGGSWSKWYLALGAADANQGFFVFVFMASSLLSIAYLMPIVGRAFFRPLAGEATDAKPTLKEAPLLCVVPLCLTAVGSVALFFAAPQIRALLLPLVGE
jgi:multicomponent Na+:H+ antiporter subunit D